MLPKMPRPLLIVFALVFILAMVPSVEAGRRAPPATRDGAKVRNLALRPEEVRARREAVERFRRWMDVASPGSALEALARLRAHRKHDSKDW